ncbi:hypothetical protein THAOC_07500 [Thalassiosira oceanica]|uniref:Uncharacterized protein n=1 Tax=Thalassiosira oceanica TaxID=159749 RepID=K0SXE0_THAOC|nr:hypothetical protein THAOC_07500 [Thalassiosira oceanica]|eukprot:EJK71093.1 hypothetical protein THAOC_07500 [Thalassiosira oceanica]
MVASRRASRSGGSSGSADDSVLPDAGSNKRKLEDGASQSNKKFDAGDGASSAAADAALHVAAHLSQENAKRDGISVTYGGGTSLTVSHVHS